MSERNDYIKAISKVGRALGTTIERDKLLQMIVKAAVDTMKGKAACLFLATDEKKDEYVAVAQTGLSKSYIHAAPTRMAPTMKLLKKDGFIHYREASKDERVLNKEAKVKEGIGSILVVPVLVRDEMMGSLALYTEDVRDFSEREIEFLTVLAEDGGMAIEKAQLIEKLRNNTRIFRDIATHITASTDIKTILQTLTEDVAKAIGVKAATIRLLDDNRVTLRLAASYGLSEKYLKKGPISAEKSIAQALQGKPVVVKDAASDAGVQYRDEKKEEGIVTILSVPIKSRDEVIGVLRLYSSTTREFTEDDVQFVTAIAYMGGVAIQNMSLLSMLKDDVKDLRENVWIFKSWF
ncbi:MAG TPA: GAF domain-containing protein [Syntrophales bacterium]|nr:GAF domain-containing protein [Syntrophales bacterium]